tara:strand:- start:2711 stop:3415 length:705 start_codon:yes stop_codon:yes gene_type:complete
MTEELEFETYLNISPNKYEIYLFDKRNLINIYRQSIKIKDSKNSIDINYLSKFVEENIFKIEKLNGKFIENITLIIDTKEIIELNFGIKKKNYEKKINKKLLENILIEAKDLFNENYQNNKILHILIKNYFINNKYFSSFQDNINGDHLCLEIQFNYIPNIFLSELGKIMEKYQINIDEYLDGNYIKNFFNNDNLEFSKKIYKIQTGFNSNEVKLIPKNIRKKGFFEKFFQLLS